VTWQLEGSKPVKNIKKQRNVQGMSAMLKRAIATAWSHPLIMHIIKILIKYGILRPVA
jgi:hypothetical protein